MINMIYNSHAKLIREGSDGPAIVRVTLLNDGEDSYKPEFYGNRIIIERQIVKRGHCGYRLLNHNGNVIIIYIYIYIYISNSYLL